MAHTQPRKPREEGALSLTRTTHQHHDFNIPSMWLSQSQLLHVLHTEEDRIGELQVSKK
jgi:hypothetical protein